MHGLATQLQNTNSIVHISTWHALVAELAETAQPVFILLPSIGKEQGIIESLQGDMVTIKLTDSRLLMHLNQLVIYR
ncbi:hypothetical protein [Spartinivicinus ruber]|uniref:hypothetical protein n=1 Tax=Spartinivicinus ruber TaxID=2683272 RepID=UPI0013D809F7|nr:hypothetical protein [Spartinivicinus ruber]